MEVDAKDGQEQFIKEASKRESSQEATGHRQKAQKLQAAGEGTSSGSGSQPQSTES